VDRFGPQLYKHCANRRICRRGRLLHDGVPAEFPGHLPDPPDHGLDRSRQLQPAIRPAEQLRHVRHLVLRPTRHGRQSIRHDRQLRQQFRFRPGSYMATNIPTFTAQYHSNQLFVMCTSVLWPPSRCPLLTSVSVAYKNTNMHDEVAPQLKCWQRAEFTNKVKNYDHFDRARLLDGVMTMTGVAMTSPNRSAV